MWEPPTAAEAIRIPGPIAFILLRQVDWLVTLVCDIRESPKTNFQNNLNCCLPLYTIVGIISIAFHIFSEK